VVHPYSEIESKSVTKKNELEHQAYQQKAFPKHVS